MTATAAVETASVDARHPQAAMLCVVRVATARGWEHLTGETTESPHLAITPEIVNNLAGGYRLTGRWVLTHVPTGSRLAQTPHVDLAELRDFARLIAHLDWSSAHPRWWRTLGPKRRHVLAEAWHRATS